MTDVKYRIRKALINFSGYFVYRKNSLPVGVDLEEDIVNKFGIDPKTVFDVGANIGQTAVSYAEMFPNAEIYSFEPFRDAFLALERNTSQLQQIKRFQLALGENATEMDVRTHETDLSYLNSLKAVNENQSNTASNERIIVDTLDGFCVSNKVNEIDLLKIDTEGFEMEVLKGGQGLLSAGRIKAILCEVALSKQNRRNSQLFELHDYLEGLGFFFVGLHDSNLNHYKEGSAYSNALFVFGGEAMN